MRFACGCNQADKLWKRATCFTKFSQWLQRFCSSERETRSRQKQNASEPSAMCHVRKMETTALCAQCVCNHSGLLQMYDSWAHISFSAIHFRVFRRLVRFSWLSILKLSQAELRFVDRFLKVCVHEQCNLWAAHTFIIMLKQVLH